MPFRGDTGICKCVGFLDGGKKFPTIPTACYWTQQGYVDDDLSGPDACTNFPSCYCPSPALTETDIHHLPYAGPPQLLS